jgi:hypothetical protein
MPEKRRPTYRGNEVSGEGAGEKERRTTCASHGVSAPNHHDFRYQGDFEPSTSLNNIWGHDIQRRSATTWSRHWVVFALRPTIGVGRFEKIIFLRTSVHMV